MNNHEIPVIGLSEAATENLGKYGRMRKSTFKSICRSFTTACCCLGHCIHASAGNRPDCPQTLGTDDAGDGAKATGAQGN